MKPKTKNKKTKKNQNRKITSAEREKRVFEVKLLRTRAFQTFEIVQYCAEKYGIARRTIEKYIQEADREIRTAQEIDREARRMQANDRYEYALKKALQNQDYKEAARINEKIAKLWGLNEPTKLDHTSGGEKIGNEIDYSKLSTETLLDLEKNIKK